MGRGLGWTIPWRNSIARQLARWRSDQAGVTAVEFGMVITPFLMLLFGIVAIGLFFFTTFSLENAVEQAARLIRTGQAQTANMTTEQFKAEVCSHAPSYVDCDGKLRVSVQKFNEWTQITPENTPKCLDSGGNLSSTATYDAPVANEVALVWVCYEWDMVKDIPFLNLGNMSNGARLIQAATTFRVEPYE
jgi:Flp pilus assembly protein TadG